MKKITMIIDRAGGTTITSQGFDGPECQQATQPLEKLLGTKVFDKPTAEMHAEVQPEIQASTG